MQDAKHFAHSESILGANQVPSTVLRHEAHSGEWQKSSYGAHATLISGKSRLEINTEWQVMARVGKGQIRWLAEITIFRYGGCGRPVWGSELKSEGRGGANQAKGEAWREGAFYLVGGNPAGSPRWSERTESFGRNEGSWWNQGGKKAPTKPGTCRLYYSVFMYEYENAKLHIIKLIYMTRWFILCNVF